MTRLVRGVDEASRDERVWWLIQVVLAVNCIFSAKKKFGMFRGHFSFANPMCEQACTQHQNHGAPAWAHV